MNNEPIFVDKLMFLLLLLLLAALIGRDDMRDIMAGTKSSRPSHKGRTVYAELYSGCGETSK